MVCVPCIVIPLLLWLWHKYLQPFVLKFWNPWGSKSIAEVSGPPEGVSSDDEHYLFIEKCISENPVMIFSKKTCSFCRMAKDVLDKVGVDYQVEEIDGREDCDKIQELFQKMTGQKTVPRVFVGKKCIGGGSETWSFHNQNQLVPMMKEAGAIFKDKKTD